MQKNSFSDMQASLNKYQSGKQKFSLPPEFYTSAEWLEFETEELLRREWICLGRTDEIAKPGDYYTLDVLGEPLLIVRDKENQIRVLSNVCRHRNMQVAEGRGCARGFVCPYHAWSYDLNGSLLRTPLMKGVKKENNALPQIRSEIWQGFLYVNIDGEALPLAPRLTGLDNILQHYHTDEMVHVFVEEEIWQTNWKCLVENFMEGYHLSMVHPKTLGGRTPSKLCKKFEGGEGYTGYRANYPKTAPDRGVCHPDLTDEEKQCSTLFCVYPSHLVSQASDILVYLCLQPAGVDQVRVRWGVSLFDVNLPEEEKTARLDLWREINEEDKAKLKKIQAALYSRHAVAGPLAPDNLEGTIKEFQKYIARSLTRP